MKKPPAELARLWLVKAHSDLHTAQQIGALPDGHLDAAIYHCQQAAEKSLKGFLVFHETPFEKVHDLGKIIQQAAQIDSQFNEYESVAECLTPYAVVYRYPDESAFLEPSREEFDEALQHAQSVYDFVLKLLPDAARPNKPNAAK
ncbi:MAG: HEPN domain-containing protein [Verrucomicrobiota bacterium]